MCGFLGFVELLRAPYISWDGVGALVLGTVSPHLALSLANIQPSRYSD